MLGFQWGSLKTRVTFFTLVIFLGGVWSLSFYAGQVLRDDMQPQLGEQQFSVASFIAADIHEAHALALSMDEDDVVPPVPAGLLHQLGLDEQVLLKVLASTEKQFAGASCALSR